ncbi:hypothetical protein A7M79_19205 [Acinetobacter baumannii]|uniref:hypothetical protein n=1 Tax=Acinetobacter baumannii TaxID=470 RepID=UPI0008DE2CC4|nr:hypothetical protein [Acinetobacter baumannii]OIH01731.1 hypothetical protein A7M79_19205 [Acinetobacter baumannii]
MTPEQFIYENGEKKARDILSQYEKFIHVKKPTHFDTDLEIFIHEADFKTGKLDESDINLSHLKRLVESLDIIEKFGYDIDGAKQLLDFCKSNKTITKSGIEITVERLKQAIEDHKAIYDKADV